MFDFFRRVRQVVHDYPPYFTYRYTRHKLSGRPPLADFDDEHRCIFVLSTGRTGTRTLEALYALSPRLCAYHEPYPRMDRLARAAYAHEQEVDAVSTRMLAEAIGTARATLFQTSFLAHRGYVETSHFNTFLAPYIAEHVPTVRFIYLVRHPYKVVVSAMKRQWYQGDFHDNSRIVPRPGMPEAAAWGEFTAFEKNAWLWHETNRWILGFLETFPADQQLHLRAEDVFDANEDATRALYTFAGVQLPAENKIERVLNKKLNAQKQGSFPSPKTWDQSMLHRVHSIVGSTADRLGYDLQVGSPTR